MATPRRRQFVEQDSQVQEILIKLSKRFGINPKAVDKWRKRETVEDLKTDPRNLRSTVLSGQEEVIIVAFRRHTLLPLR